MNSIPEQKYVEQWNNDVLLAKAYDSSKHNIIGWHAYTSALTEMEELESQQLITGGTCSAMRTIGIGHTLGFREFHIFGMDCAMDGEPDDPEEKDMYGRTKWVKTGILTEKTKEEKDVEEEVERSVALLSKEDAKIH